MTDEMLLALIGAGGALVGSVVGAVTTYFVQKKLIAAQSSRDIKKDFLGRQLVALQELNLAIDFVFGNEGRTEGGPVAEVFVSIIKESPRHLAFLPTDLREDARKLMFEFFKGGRGGDVKVELGQITALQKRVLDQIDKVFAEYSHDS
jgi:hypothetical protein